MQYTLLNSTHHQASYICALTLDPKLRSKSCNHFPKIYICQTHEL